MGHEGFYANNPDDPGGETWKGIARNKWPAWGGWAVIDRVKIANPRNLQAALAQSQELETLVQAFYEAHFFRALNLDRIEQAEIACELFDTAVNQGAETAGRYFQQALNLLNDNGRHYADLRVDGKPGELTLQAYKAYLNTAGLPGRSLERNVKTLLKVLNGLQFETYKNICAANARQEVFFYGWMNRV